MRRLFLLLTLFVVGCGSAEKIEDYSLSSASFADFVDEPWWTYQLPADAQLNRRHVLYKYFVVAKQKKLPTNLFRDLIRANSGVKLSQGDWPSYQPGGAFSGGTIRHPAIAEQPASWKRIDWASFYNELFHAWWQDVFMKSGTYSSERSQLLTSERSKFYRQAHPRNPRLAQEEAYSETINTLMFYTSPQYNPETSEQDRFYALNFFVYNKNRTVSPVSHSDRPGFTSAAEQTFPAEWEWKIVFKMIFGSEAP